MKIFASNEEAIEFIRTTFDEETAKKLCDDIERKGIAKFKDTEKHTDTIIVVDRFGILSKDDGKDTNIEELMTFSSHVENPFKAFKQTSEGTEQSYCSGEERREILRLYKRGMLPSSFQIWYTGHSRTCHVMNKDDAKRVRWYD